MLSPPRFGSCLMLTVALFGCDSLEMPETVRNENDPLIDGPAAGQTAGAPEDSTAAAAAEEVAADKPQVRLIKIDGTVTVNGEPAEVDAEVPRDATIEAGPNGYAILTIGGTSVIEIRSKTKVTLGASDTAEWSLKLALGTLWSFIDSGTRYEVLTDNAVAGVRGTTFFVQTKKKKTYVCACDGSVQITAKNKKSFDKLVHSPHQDHKSFNITTKKKRKQKVKKAKRIGHTDEQKTAIMEAQSLL